MTRIGLRYINRIDIPLADLTKKVNGRPVLRMEDYLRFYPQFPEDVFGPSNYIAAQQRFEIGADDCIGLLNLVSAPPALLNHMSLVLDLDISREKSVPQNYDALWELIERMRHHKNRLFETVITDRSRALFQR